MKLFKRFKKNKNVNENIKKVLEELDDYIRKHFVWPDASGHADEGFMGTATTVLMYDESMAEAMAAVEMHHSHIDPSMHPDFELISDVEAPNPTIAAPKAEKRHSKKMAASAEAVCAAPVEAPCAAPVEASGSALSKAKKDRKLKDVVLHVSDTWQESLLRIIDERGLRDSAVYKKAGIDRKLFSKIRSNKDYQPKKSTAVLFALALELSLDETKDMLARAGFALSPSSVSDLIIEYFIKNDVHDIYTINMALFSHDQPVLGE